MRVEGSVCSAGPATDHAPALPTTVRSGKDPGEKVPMRTYEEVAWMRDSDRRRQADAKIARQRLKDHGYAWRHARAWAIANWHAGDRRYSPADCPPHTVNTRVAEDFLISKGVPSLSVSAVATM